MRVPSSLILFLRTAGSILFALTGWYVADLIPYADLPEPLNNTVVLHLSLALVPGILAFLLLPALLARPVNSFIDQVSRASGVQIIADFMGFATGLLIAALLAFPLALLPDPFRQVLPLLCAVIFSYIGVVVMNVRYREFFAILNIRIPSNKLEELEAPGGRAIAGGKDRILLDTSVIIDGRIADILATGFLRSALVVPRFVLNEVQRVADSPDALRRARGRRGLEVLKRIQREAPAQVAIVEADTTAARDVDEKLILLAREWQCPIMTNDFNLNRVASLQGVTVLNINELANAVKSVLIPGETLTIKIIQEGKEAGQGVGYLDDGTMVVVEEGRDRLNENITVTVTKVLQTSAGRMIFAKPLGDRLSANS
ncbi:MAG: TRAM domain-containing protein [Anaerolineae bacterium]|nr:TRAM domain-containing protein [Thermoflexales bacterium]MDW8408180.1 TRAM domain-containing protein [Anaerolineae bacterium]